MNNYLSDVAYRVKTLNPHLSADDLENILAATAEELPDYLPRIERGHSIQWKRRDLLPDEAATFDRLSGAIAAKPHRAPAISPIDDDDWSDFFALAEDDDEPVETAPAATQEPAEKVALVADDDDSGDDWRELLDLAEEDHEETVEPVVVAVEPSPEPEEPSPVDDRRGERRTLVRARTLFHIEAVAVERRKRLDLAAERELSFTAHADHAEMTIAEREDAVAAAYRDAARSHCPDWEPFSTWPNWRGKHQAVWQVRQLRMKLDRHGLPYRQTIEAAVTYHVTGLRMRKKAIRIRPIHQLLNDEPAGVAALAHVVALVTPQTVRTVLTDATAACLGSPEALKPVRDGGRWGAPTPCPACPLRKKCFKIARVVKNKRRERFEDAETVTIMETKADRIEQLVRRKQW